MNNTPAIEAKTIRDCNGMPMRILKGISRNRKNNVVAKAPQASIKNICFGLNVILSITVTWIVAL
ncbi:MAG: hypothetical protein ACI9UJ_002629 [bacterium]|jgi:hypothetical protein